MGAFLFIHMRLIQFDKDAFTDLPTDVKWAELHALLQSPEGFIIADARRMVECIMTSWDHRTTSSSANVVFLASPMHNRRSENVFMRSAQINTRLGLIIYRPRFTTLEKLRRAQDVLNAEYDERIHQLQVDLSERADLTKPYPDSEYTDAANAAFNSYRDRLSAASEQGFLPLTSAPPEVMYVNPMWWCPRCETGSHRPVEDTACVLDALNGQGVSLAHEWAEGLRVCSFDPVRPSEPVLKILTSERFKLPVVRGHRSENPCPSIPWGLRQAARRKPSQHIKTFAKMTDATEKILKYGRDRLQPG